LKCGLGWQKKERREKLVIVTRGRRDRNLFCKGVLSSYDVIGLAVVLVYELLV
jgi:hypothetical protein